ncbi:hypothetical protein GCM10022393_15730 [Aquimarina addita]|uniref:Cyclic peptide export ABC transporter n=1 Tax=Aquimarina addita TaxID=870485 RepID=A0ABP7XHR3_9FLAO
MENIANGLYISTSIIAFIGVFYLGIVSYQTFKKDRKINFSLKNAYNYFLGFLVLAPVLASLYFFPIAFYDQDFWLETKSQYIESRQALKFLGIIILSFYTFTRGAIFLPHKDEYYNIGPKLLFLSLFPGIASALNVMIISKFITANFNANYLLGFFAVTTFIYIITSRISKRVTVRFGILTAHKFNVQVVSKIFKIPHRKQEQIKDGKTYTILNDDISSIFSFSQGIIGTYTNVITLIIVEVYLFTISWVSASLLLGITVLIMGIFTLMSPQIKKATNNSRLKREKYSNFISGLIHGFKELVLHKIKRDKYQKDMEDSSKESYNASQKSINVGIDAGLVSELSFSVAIGISCLLFPLIFDMEKEVITAFVLAVLFLWGPVSMILNGIPQIVNVKVSLDRIKAFLKDAETEELVSNQISEKIEIPFVQSIKVEDVYFNYGEEEESITYGVGPINFVANEGELIFIVGGNGSGKTTFLKLLIGLYKPTSGNILVNGSKIDNKSLGECFSVIYSDFYLFQKLYDLNEDRLDQVNDWLEVLQLSDKVKIEDGVFSTIDLSKGQRKRLAILKSYLEDRPVYFFDEVAADLDPAFRDFFYNELLVKMRQEGKILIIISHDDKYFNLADNIYKMEMGKISSQTKELLALSEQY